MKPNPTSLEKLKDELNEIKGSLNAGHRNKRKFKKEMKKKENKVFSSHAEKNGLDGISEQETQDIPVSSNGTNNSPGFGLEKLDVIDRDDGGTSIEEIENLDDFSDNE